MHRPSFDKFRSKSFLIFSIFSPSCKIILLRKINSWSFKMTIYAKSEKFDFSPTGGGTEDFPWTTTSGYLQNISTYRSRESEKKKRLSFPNRSTKSTLKAIDELLAQSCAEKYRYLRNGFDIFFLKLKSQIE